jgi:uncharacterized protein involved in type VI secretion and phage assembly
MNRAMTRRTSEPTNPTTTQETIINSQGSTKMQAMYEALARERIREMQKQAQAAHLASELAAHRREHRVSHRSRPAQPRHANWVHRVMGR